VEDRSMVFSGYGTIRQIDMNWKFTAKEKVRLRRRQGRGAGDSPRPIL
jgi:hypothetical protein